MVNNSSNIKIWTTTSYLDLLKIQMTTTYDLQNVSSGLDIHKHVALLIC